MPRYAGLGSSNWQRLRDSREKFEFMKEVRYAMWTRPSKHCDYVDVVWDCHEPPCGWHAPPTGPLSPTLSRALSTSGARRLLDRSGSARRHKLVLYSPRLFRRQLSWFHSLLAFFSHTTSSILHSALPETLTAVLILVFDNAGRFEPRGCDSQHHFGFHSWKDLSSWLHRRRLAHRLLASRWERPCRYMKPGSLINLCIVVLGSVTCWVVQWFWGMRHESLFSAVDDISDGVYVQCWDALCSGRCCQCLQWIL